MIRNGYKPEKGLGASLQGITEPIMAIKNEGTSGLGFKPTTADKKWAKNHKVNGWVLSKSIPHISQSFVRPKYDKEEEVFTSDEIDEIYEGLKEML